MNLSHRTRKEQIQRYLEEHREEWVNGSDLATEAVGGSEGLRRLRELRDEGLLIEQRRHPDPRRDIWQYRLREPNEITPRRVDAPRKPSHIEPIAPPSKIVFGVNRYCDKCSGKGRKGGTDCPHCGGKGWT